MVEIIIGTIFSVGLILLMLFFILCSMIAGDSDE